MYAKLLRPIGLIIFFSLTLFLASCTIEVGTGSEPPNETGVLALPNLESIDAEELPLQVVATTSIIGDVVSQVGGESIDLTVLIAPGQDPHSYEPAARDLTTVASATVIFVNGWDLEETFIHDLEEIGNEAVLVPISANIIPLPPSAEGDDHDDEGDDHDDEDDHLHTAADPHVWMAIDNVKQWVANVEMVLSDLDPDNASQYAANASRYLEQLTELEQFTESQLAEIPDGARAFVTNHDALGYFANRYQFTLLGTVIPGASTLAEPSADDLTSLIDTMAANNACAIFAETTVSDSLAQTVVAELDDCAEVAVVQLYTGSIGPAGSGADSYIGMYRSNIEAITAALR